ncbi:TspO/MBR family protein [Altericista sp. CCNU0014]|uniref:TspO/MBR family protein n=1 Tax=Altericista sp. CCNU0014 TaxID=3082949 RepID=UPI00384AFC43
MIPAWLVIGGVALLVALAINLLLRGDLKWFFQLRRPRWLTFERAIPVIWTVIFVCGGWSAYIVWVAEPGTSQTWGLMAGYLLLEIVTLLYTPIMCNFHSLKIGAAIGATGFFVCLILSLLVLPVSGWAVALLLPYLLWSPIGTFVTWKMIPLNPGAA